jgi:hypothetical protein
MKQVFNSVLFYDWDGIKENNMAIVFLFIRMDQTSKEYFRLTQNPLGRSTGWSPDWASTQPS